ncbi:MAG TPA: putative Fe-S cluster assembly protein SufT [Candidatus Binataceae bacterium]|nr:putative Fe-S cluster assembly protein SufT [Candidatus Binataceae bacterium]
MERVELSRDCDAVQVPSGDTVRLKAGTEVTISQSLGGTFTVQAPVYGGMFRIAGKDADALGKDPDAAVAAQSAGGGDLESMVWDQLKTCYDPEIPVNIVDLGLVYGMTVTTQPEGGSVVDVKMTLTAQGCGMGASIAFDAKQKIMGLPGVSEANVDLVWDPPWNPQMISPEGRERLGLD